MCESRETEKKKETFTLCDPKMPKPNKFPSNQKGQKKK